MLDIPRLKNKSTENRTSYNAAGSAEPDTVASGASVSNIRPRLLIGAIVVSSAFFLVTTPKTVPSIMLIVGFMMLAILLGSVLRLVMAITGIDRKMSPAYRRGILIAGTVLPVIFLIMQSIGQLTVRDVLTLVSLCAIGIFYSSRMRRRA